MHDEQVDTPPCFHGDHSLAAMVAVLNGDISSVPIIRRVGREILFDTDPHVGRRERYNRSGTTEQKKATVRAALPFDPPGLTVLELMAEIQERTGGKVTLKSVRHWVRHLVAEHAVRHSPARANRRYWVA